MVNERLNSGKTRIIFHIKALTIRPLPFGKLPIAMIVAGTDGGELRSTPNGGMVTAPPNVRNLTFGKCPISAVSNKGILNIPDQASCDTVRVHEWQGGSDDQQSERFPWREPDCCGAGNLIVCSRSAGRLARREILRRSLADHHRRPEGLAVRQRRFETRR